MLRCASDNPWFIIFQLGATPTLGGAALYLGAAILKIINPTDFNQTSLHDYFMRGLISTTAAMLILKLFLNCRRNYVDDGQYGDRETLFTPRVRLAVTAVLSLGITGFSRAWHTDSYTQRMTESYLLGAGVFLASLSLSLGLSLALKKLCVSRAAATHHEASVVMPLPLPNPRSASAVFAPAPAPASLALDAEDIVLDIPASPALTANTASSESLENLAPAP